MMRRIMIWWYQRALEGATIDLEVQRLKVIDVNSRIGYYGRKLNTLRTSE